MSNNNLKTNGVKGIGSEMSAEHNMDSSSIVQLLSKTKTDTVKSVMKGKK